MEDKAVFIETDSVGENGVPDYIEEGAQRELPRRVQVMSGKGRGGVAQFQV
jgi:hypothetical protein